LIAFAWTNLKEDKMEFCVNNERKINLEQDRPDGPVNVTIWAAPSADGTCDCEDEYIISPGDFVTMLNWYRYQKETGNTDLSF